MKYKLLLFIFCSSVFVACKSTNTATGTGSGKQALSGREQADVTYLFYNANKEKILGNMNTAAELFSEVIRKDPGNHAALYELANIYTDQKKFSDALFFIKSAYKLNPKNLWYALLLSEIYQKNKKFSDGAQVLEQLVKDYPDRFDFYFEWATALIFADKPADAIKVYDKLEAKTGVSKEVIIQKSRLYQRLGKNEKAIDELQKYIELNPKDAQAYGMIAEVYQNMGNKQKALETYNKVLDVDPDNPYIHLSLADFYRSNGEKEKSISELKLAFNNKELDVDTKISILASYLSLNQLHPELKDQAMELCNLLIQAHPSEARAHAVFGDFLRRDQQPYKARDEYRTAKNLGAKEFEVYKAIIGLDFSLQSWDTLITECDEALTLFPEQPTIYLFDGIAQSQKKKYTEAAKLLNAGVQLVVDDKELQVNFYSSLGDVFQEMKDFEKSEENYEKALVINPKADGVLNNYAYYLSLRGEKLEKAEAMSKLSNELKPESSTFEDTYGWVLYRQGNYKEAKTWIGKSLKHGSEKSATVLEHYGDVLYKNGEIQKALEYWQKAKDAGEGASEFLEKKILEKKLPD